MSEKFRGLLYAPSYQDEVIMLFGMVLPYLDYKFEIEEYTDTFPDCSAMLNGEKVGIEFEVYASKFEEHKHHLDPRLPNCSWIVCWKNNKHEKALTYEQKDTKQKCRIKIIELREIIADLERKGIRLILNPEKQKHPVSKWEMETFLKQLEERVDDKDYSLMKKLLGFCENHKEFEVVFGRGKIASFVVRVKKWGKIAPFGGQADGIVWVSFKDADKGWVYPSGAEAELRRRFNQPTKYYKNYRIKDTETLNRIEEALEWLAETSMKGQFLW